MNDFHDYNYSGNKYSNNPNFSEAFVPHVYDDEEERLEDQRIQYDQFEGDYYDLNTVHLPPTPAPASNAGAPVSRNITPHQPSLIYVPPPQSPFEMVAPPPPQSPFGNEFEYGEPPEEEPPREEIPDPEPQKALLISGINGHLVLDCPVADELLSKYNNYDPNNPDGGGLKREFSYMRYTAVTCGPSNFERDNYILRQVHYTPEPRQTELMVVVTMYNEDDILLARTLKGVFKNIKHLESRTRSSTWGPNSWKKVVVCVVSDGRSKINERAQALLAALGVYQAGLAKSVVDDRKVQAHMYEYTTRVGIASVGDTVKLTTEKIVPVQMLFCLKEKNAKKINSHRWCFDAIAKLLKPEVVVLLDAGTQPTADLGAAVKKEDGSFDVNVPTEAAEINQCYLEELEKIKKPIDNSGDKYIPTHEDYYAFIRSMTVLVWMISNFVIIALVLETGGFNQFESESSLSKTKQARAEVFLTVILWLVAFMALYRFIGCVLYLIQRFVSKFKSNTAVHRQKV
ncbi:Chitin synthase, class 2 [Cerrena zonata]|uniref:Chitin synthase n=1 Tax=Cerrena zonata TaxID=2478898 RepID=A0AAW0G4N7_9APHY